MSVVTCFVGAAALRRASEHHLALPATGLDLPRGARPEAAGMALCAGRGMNVLVDVEDVVWVVLRLDTRQAVVVVAVGGADAFLSFLHHEVDVCAAGGVGMGRVPVADAPVAHCAGVGWVGVDAEDDLGPL